MSGNGFKERKLRTWVTPNNRTMMPVEPVASSMSICWNAGTPTQSTERGARRITLLIESLFGLIVGSGGRSQLSEPPSTSMWPSEESRQDSFMEHTGVLPSILLQLLQHIRKG